MDSRCLVNATARYSGQLQKYRDIQRVRVDRDSWTDGQNLAEREERELQRLGC